MARRCTSTRCCGRGDSRRSVDLLDSGNPLAGGHSIASSEPIFGLAVTGRVSLKHIKRNATANAGDRLFLTKPLGVGVLATAQKRGHLAAPDLVRMVDQMCALNEIGPELARIDGVSSMTDVTGFGLLGHLREMCLGSGVRAMLDLDRLPILENVQTYINVGCVPGGTERNHESYRHDIAPMNSDTTAILCDPQTSGGLLLAVHPDAASLVVQRLNERGLNATSIGRILPDDSGPRICFDDGDKP